MRHDNHRFQSTHSCRVRQDRQFVAPADMTFQSTHSCRVRRDPDPRRQGVERHFNPRTRVECDSGKTAKIYDTQLFQSTHSCRVRRPSRPRFWTHLSHFNPRTRVECDVENNSIMKKWRYFNPRTRVECDMQVVNLEGENKNISIHALV